MIVATLRGKGYSDCSRIWAKFCRRDHLLHMMKMKLYHMLWYILILYYVLWFNMKLCLIKSDIILHYKVWCYIILSDQDIYLFIGWVVTFSLNCNYMDSEINDSRLDRMMMAIPPIGWKAGKSWEWRSTKEKCSDGRSTVDVSGDYLPWLIWVFMVCEGRVAQNFTRNRARHWVWNERRRVCDHNSVISFEGAIFDVNFHAWKVK